VQQGFNSETVHHRYPSEAGIASESAHATLAALAGLEWLLAPLDTWTMLEKAVAEVRGATGTDMAFGGFSVSASQTRISALDGARTRSLLDLDVAPGRGLGGQAMARRTPAVSRDYAQDASISDDYRPQVAPEDLKGLIAVPVLVDGEVRGVLWVGNRAPTEFGDRIVDAVAIAARKLAVAMTVAERARRDRELAVAQERQRVATALHDSVGALLFTIRASIHDLEQRLAEDAGVLEKLTALEGHADQAASALRESLRVLYASAAEIVVGASIRSDARAFEHRSGIPTRLAIAGELPELTPASAEALTSAVREGLLNVEKHARARTVAISAFATEETVEALVTDDGVGIGQIATDGIGLRATRDRLTRLGGSLVLAQNTEGGATLHATVPR
jgi:signal transduction histidine kinase